MFRSSQSISENCLKASKYLNPVVRVSFYSHWALAVVVSEGEQEMTLCLNLSPRETIGTTRENCIHMEWWSNCIHWMERNRYLSLSLTWMSIYKGWSNPHFCVTIIIYSTVTFLLMSLEMYLIWLTPHTMAKDLAGREPCSPEFQFCVNKQILQ